MSQRTDIAPARETLSRLKALLRDDPHLKARFEAAKDVIRVFRRPRFYEVSQRCNLFCEGCYYFEGPTAYQPGASANLEQWVEFFRREADERHVSMAYFIGAEPSLEQERLFAASECFDYGNVGTNGTVKIDPAIPFRVSISSWGDPDTDTIMRGAPAFRKALINYRGDPRAIVVYTLSAWNLEATRKVAEMCKDHGIPLTFNMYSPTAAFMDKANRGDKNDKAYFRLSEPGKTPTFDKAGLIECRKVVRSLMEDFPETIVYTGAYNDWVTDPNGMFDIDPLTGIAIDCGSKIQGTMQYFGSDLMPKQMKCCTPDIDCSECRMYSAGWSTRLQIQARDVVSAQAFEDWCDIVATLGEIFVLPREKALQAMAHADRESAKVAPQFAAQ